MKNHTIKNVILCVLLIFAGLELSAQCHPTWKFAAPIEVSNSTEFALSSFQVRTVVNTASLVSAGKMQSNGDDIRFSESGSCDFLHYWIESGMNTAATVIWIKTNTIPAEGTQTITMYYGNTSAGAYQNGDSTFDFFDDFDGSALNTNKWNKYGPGTSSFLVSGGKITIKSLLSSADAILRTKNTIPGPITAEANFTSLPTTGTGAPSLAILSNTGFFGYTLNYKSGAMNMGAADGGCNSYSSTTITSNTSPGAVTGIWGIQWPMSNLQMAYWPGDTIMTADTGKDVSTDVNVAVGNLCNGSKTIQVDWVRVRKYAEAEPTSIPDLSKEKKNDKGSASINVDPGPYCQGDAIEIPYTTFGNIDSGNVFTAQISDASGSFANPVTIGTYTSNSDGTIFATLPSNVYGDNFSIRVIGTDTSMTSVPSPANIVISAPPAADAGADRGICIGNSTTIGAAAVSGSTYSWTSSNSSWTSSEAGPTVTPDVTTTYTLTETNALGCTNTNSVTVTVNPLPIADAGADQTIQTGSTTIGAAAVSGYSYSWTSTPSGFTSTDAQPSVSPTETTTYTLTVTNEYGCTSTDAVVITVKNECDNDGDGNPDKEYGTKNCNADGKLCAWFSPDGKKVIVTSTGKDLSNIVVKYDGCSNKKYDGLNGKKYTITSSSCEIVGVWVKAGNNKSGDCPGCGEYILNLYGSGNTNGCKDDNGSSAPVFLGSESEEMTENTLTVYPNPFANQANVQVALLQEDMVSIDVVSMDGRVVQALFSGQVEAQTMYNFTIDGSALRSGVYMVRVMGGNTVEYRKVILQK